MTANQAGEPIIAIAELPESPAGLSQLQIANAESLPIGKRRAERKAVYGLINRHISHGLILSHNSDGAPILLYPGSTPFPGYFSLSHCRTAAAIVYSPIRHIGIDIEDASPRLRRIVDKFLSEGEKRLIFPLTDKNLLAAWTFKEAAFKCLGDSRLVLSGIIIESLHDEGPSIAIRASSISGKAEGHVTFSPGNERAIAVALRLMPQPGSVDSESRCGI